MTSVKTRRRALITGAGGGIGSACAVRLAQQGWDVVLHAAHHPERLDAVRETCAQAGAGVTTWVADLAEPEVDKRLLDALGKDHGITGLVHAAGFTADGLAIRVRDDDIQKLLQIHLAAAMQLVRGLSRAMLSARWGRVVLIGSTAGLAGNPGQAAYAAAKTGQIGYARSLARELGPRNITANVVAPGWIETGMTIDILNRNRDAIIAEIPAGRVGRPEEVAATVGFLMGEEAGYITGQTVCVNGGLWML